MGLFRIHEAIFIYSWRAIESIENTLQRAKNIVLSTIVYQPSFSFFRIRKSSFKKKANTGTYLMDNVEE